MFKFCLFSFLATRIIFISFILLVYDTFPGIERYDRSSDILDMGYYSSIVEEKAMHFLKNFYSYDSVHFIHIAKDGYTSDNNYAFFPFFPLMIRYLRNFFCFLCDLSGWKVLSFANPLTLYMISGFLISNALCWCNTLLLYRLCLFLTASSLRSQVAVLLFLINPGTIFYISIYSENLYFCLQMLLIFMLIVKRGSNNFLGIGVIILGLLTTRSNSLFLCAYFIIPVILLFISSDKKFDYRSFTFNLHRIIKIVKTNLSSIGKYIILCAHAYLCFVWMTKLKPRSEICHSVFLNINHDLDKFTQYSSYCHGSTQNITNIYSYIQKSYWDVSLLSQYRLDKLDRIILALPMNILSVFLITAVLRFFNWKSLLILNIPQFVINRKQIDNATNSSSHIEKREIYFNSFILASFVNYVALFLLVLLMAHPQINNRLLSACPLLYLYGSDEAIKFLSNSKHYWKGFCIIVYFVLFSFLSCLMHAGSYGFA